jgi:hypothetical protein
MTYGRPLLTTTGAFQPPPGLPPTGPGRGPGPPGLGPGPPL